MKILVANLGSTSFKFRLFEMEQEAELARGAVEEIGTESSRVTIKTKLGDRDEVLHVAEHSDALETCLAMLADLGVDCDSAGGDFAIGFKAVHGGKYVGVELVNEDVIREIERLGQVAPAHNPPYAKAMRLLKKRFPDVPQVAAFETSFHADAPPEYQVYAIPYEWSEDYQVVKRGFHGASHRYVAEHMKELAPNCQRIISCHLGGSSSLCGIRDGVSLGATMGMSPQSGLPQSNRCGDFDPFALPLVMEATGLGLNDTLEALANKSGLLGMSGVSSDLRKVIEQAESGNVRAQLAIDVFVAEIRRHLGGMLVRLNGADAIVFTGGIGERSGYIRERICESLDELGLVLDSTKNETENDLSQSGDGRIDAGQSRIEIWLVATNEELIVARQTMAKLEKQTCL